MSRISLDDIFRSAIDVIDRERIRYFVYGGLAIPAWGGVLTTDDVDLVIRVDEGEGSRLMAALRMAGFHVPPNTEKLFFIDTWFIASREGRDVDFALGATEFDASALTRAVRMKLYDRTVPVASAEDLILYKLVAQRRKDIVHIEDILIRQAGNLDVAYLRGWARRIAEATGKYEVTGTLEKMLAEQGLGRP